MFNFLTPKTLSDKRFYTYLKIIVSICMVFMLFNMLYPDTCYIVTKICILCLSSYLMISVCYAPYMSPDLLIPILSFFFGLTNILSIFEVAQWAAGKAHPTDLSLSIQIYYVGRISFAISLIVITYIYAHKRHLLQKVSKILTFACLVFFILGFYIFDSSFIYFVTQRTLPTFYFNFLVTLIIPIALIITSFNIKVLFKTLPSLQRKILIFFLVSSSILETSNILYSTRYNARGRFPLFSVFIASIVLVIAHIDSCIIKPFADIHLEKQQVEQSLNSHSQSLTQYSKHLKQLEATLHTQASYYQKLISIIPEPFIVCIDMIIYQMNPAALQLFGVNHVHDLVGTNILNYIKDAPDLHKQYQTLFSEEGTLLEGEGILTSPDNHTYHIEYVFASSNFYTPDTVVCTLRDVTAKYESEKIRQALSSQTIKLDQFSNISHDIKTPIHIIYSALQMQHKATDLPDALHYTDMMHTSCLKLLKLLNNLLDSTKLENHMVTPSPQEFNLVDAVETLCESCLPYISSKDLSYVFDTDIDEKYVYLDASWIERIMLNLLSNAIKYTPATGSIYVSIYDHGTSATIHIEDTGIGIPPSKVHTIFNRYTMVSTNDLQLEHSSGLGLCIVYDLLHLMDGSITCISTLGAGTEFIVTLPTPPREVNVLPEQYTVNISTQNLKVEFCDI